MPALRFGDRVRYADQRVIFGAGAPVEGVVLAVAPGDGGEGDEADAGTLVLVNWDNGFTFGTYSSVLVKVEQEQETETEKPCTP